MLLTSLAESLVHFKAGLNAFVSLDSAFVAVGRQTARWSRSASPNAAAPPPIGSATTDLAGTSAVSSCRSVCSTPPSSDQRDGSPYTRYRSSKRPNGLGRQPFGALSIAILTPA